MPRLTLWPLWAAALGVALPAMFLRAFDGWIEYLSSLDIAVSYATALAFHGVLLAIALLVAGLLARLCIRFVPRLQPEFVNACVVAASRALLVAVVAMLAIHWVEAVSGAELDIGKLGKGLVLAGSVIVAAAATWRSPQPGPLLQLGRSVALASILISIGLLALQLVRSAQDQAPSPQRAAITRAEHPDVVLITIDALSAPHMSLYGNPLPTSPQIDRFAKDYGIVFDRFYANANYTTPGVASIVFGARQWDHRSIHLPSRALERTRSTNLLKSFHDQGYRTLTVDTNIWGSPAWQRLLPWVDERSAVRIGRVDSLLGAVLPWMPGIAEMAVGFGLYKFVLELADKATVAAGLYGVNDHWLPELAFSDARRMWTESAESPRFLWVHLLPPHDPYAAPEPFLGMFDPASTKRTRFDSAPPYRFKAAKDPAFPQQYLGRYHESIAYMDHGVGEFLEWLRKDGSFDQALIAISADHGESFLQGYGGHTGPLLTEELIHVPLVIKMPGASQAGTRIGAVAEQADLAPTLVKLAGLEVDAGYRGRALDLKGALAGDADTHAAFSMNFERSGRFSALTAGSVAMIQGPYKYVHYLGLERFKDYPQLNDALYEVVSDPKETRDLIREQPERAAAMLAAIRKELEAHGGALQ